MPFTDKTIIITGASGNLGRAVAQAFAELGARIALLDLRKDRLQEGEKRLFLETNLFDPDSVAAVVERAVGHFGRIDVLCNIAGGFRMGPPVHETSDADWDFLFDINARSVLYAARAVVPHMLKAGGGRIVNVGAYAAQHGVAGMGAYVASKSAVIRLTETMAAELREKHINVNCVLPTIIDTPENRAAMPDADPRRWVAPQDLAAVVVFLASDAARAIHGAALPVSGLS